MAAPATAPTPAPTVPVGLAQPRVIPGFKTAAVNAPKPARSRSKKSKVPATTTAAGQDAEEEATVVVVSETVEAGEEDYEIVDEVEEKKLTSSVEAVQKRIRAASKKLQRIVTYEEKTEALNADQQKAVASKPVLEAVVKELQELLQILKIEETEDEARLGRIKAVEERKQARKVAAAIAETESKAQGDMVVLFQFLHLHGLYHPQSNGFAPQSLPSVVANATGQDVAAVRSLYDAFTNGPLLGGHDDAISKLAKIASASTDLVLPGVTFARIGELITGLTSPPHQAPIVVAPSVAEPVPAVSALLATTTNDSTVSLIDGSSATPLATPSFLQASELNQAPAVEEKVASWAEEVEDNEQQQQQQPTTTTNGHIPVVAAAPVAPAPVDSSWSAPPATLDWSSEDMSTELPHLEGLPVPVSAPVPAAATTTMESPAAADGYQQAGRPRRGGPAGGGGGRGGPHRGGGGGGGYNGPPREGGAQFPVREGGGRGGERAPFRGGGGGGGRGRGMDGGEFAVRGRGKGAPAGRGFGRGNGPRNDSGEQQGPQPNRAW